MGSALFWQRAGDGLKSLCGARTCGAQRQNSVFFALFRFYVKSQGEEIRRIVTGLQIIRPFHEHNGSGIVQRVGYFIRQGRVSAAVEIACLLYTSPSPRDCS